MSEHHLVWAAGITYLHMALGFLYLLAIVDWHSWDVEAGLTHSNFLSF